uniref:C2H2-type domain-containing protein n=1 Tax=Anopheles christyi TaxID=43041 RepID=A0A182JVS2_9DIPT
MTHTGEFPYVCEICNAMFRTLGRYNRHMQKGHVLPPGLHVIEQTETNSWDDLIEYQPELMINDTLDEAASEMMLAMGESTSDSSLLSDQLINQAPGEFVVQCGETAERFMPFLECS